MFLGLGAHCAAAIQPGIALSCAADAGSLPSSGFIVSPQFWLKYSSEEHGWWFGLDAIFPTLASDSYMSRVKRVAAWGMRYKDLQVYSRTYTLYAGAGWGLESYKWGSVKTLRGALGFRAGLGTTVWDLGGRSLECVIGYVAMPWPGTGMIEDRFDVTLRLPLFAANVRSSETP